MTTFMSIKVEGADGVIELLKMLPPEMVSKRGGPVKSALRKAALVIQKEAKKNVRLLIEAPNKDNRPNVSTGALERSIIVSRGRPPVNGNGERYIVYVPKLARSYSNTKSNLRKHRVGKTYFMDPPTYYGRMLETGTVKMRAHRWLEPAAIVKRQEAVSTFTRELSASIDRLLRKKFKMNAAR